MTAGHAIIQFREGDPWTTKTKKFKHPPTNTFRSLCQNKRVFVPKPKRPRPRLQNYSSPSPEPFFRYDRLKGIFKKKRIPPLRAYIPAQIKACFRPRNQTWEPCTRSGYTKSVPEFSGRTGGHYPRHSPRTTYARFPHGKITSVSLCTQRRQSEHAIELLS